VSSEGRGVREGSEKTGVTLKENTSRTDREGEVKEEKKGNALTLGEKRARKRVLPPL